MIGFEIGLVAGLIVGFFEQRLQGRVGDHRVVGEVEPDHRGQDPRGVGAGERLQRPRRGDREPVPRVAFREVEAADDDVHTVDQRQKALGDHRRVGVGVVGPAGRKLVAVGDRPAAASLDPVVA